MKKLLPLIAVVLLSMGACKKNSDSTTTPTTTGGTTWMLAGTTYTLAFSYHVTASGSGANQLYNFCDAIPSGPNPKVNSVTVSFITAPTASGTFQLVGAGQAKTASQCELAAGTSASAAYAYIGASTDITVTVTGGKLKIVIPEVTLKSTTTNPDAKFSCSVSEM